MTVMTVMIVHGYDLVLVGSATSSKEVTVVEAALVPPDSFARRSP
jgi:hypothetical protein